MQSYAGQDKAGHGQFTIMHSPVFLPMLSEKKIQKYFVQHFNRLKKWLLLNIFFLNFED